jgi:predicted dehydrogenase
MKNNPGVAVIGSGYWGKNLIRNYSQIGALRMICDNNETVLDVFKKQYPDVDVCLTINDILSRKDIQGVVIATPAEKHFSIAREALLAGKHVFVEKPLVLDEAEALELIELAKQNKCVLMVGHLMQYHPLFQHLKALVAKGDLGRINYIYSHRLNLGKIRREENALWSFAPHDISMILSLAGDMPETVQSTGGNYLHKKIADVTTTHMTFASGMQSHIFVSWLHPFKEQKLVIVGDRKMAVFDDTLAWNEKLLLYPHEIKWENNMPIPTRTEPEKVHDIPQTEPLANECQIFIQAMKTGKQPLTDGNEGLRVLKVLNASQASLEKDGLKINITNTSSQKSKSAKIHLGQNAFVHSSAIVDDNVTIGDNTKVWHFSHVLGGTKIGNNCNIGQNVVLGPDITIGNQCKIQNNVSVYKGVTIEDDVFCGPSMVFTNVYNPRAFIRRMDEIKPTLIKKGASIGANATIVCGTTIGSYAFVGAGAVVKKDVADYAMVAGNPARQIGWICQCGCKLDSRNVCGACGNKYPKLKKLKKS